MSNVKNDFLVTELDFVIKKLIDLEFSTRRRRQKRYDLHYCIQCLIYVRNYLAEGGRDE